MIENAFFGLVWFIFFLSESRYQTRYAKPDSRLLDSMKLITLSSGSRRNYDRKVAFARIFEN